MNGNYSKAIVKIITVSVGILLSSLLVFAPLIGIIFPSLYIGSLVNSTFNGIGTSFGEMFDTDYKGNLNEDIDSYEAEERISIDYLNIIDCITSDKKVKDPEGCLIKSDSNGKIDTSKYDSTSYFTLGFEEWTGSFEKDIFTRKIHVPGLYQEYENHYSETIENGKTVKTDNWILNKEIKSGKCSNTENSRCLIIREDKDVDPFIQPSSNFLVTRYGLYFDSSTFDSGIKEYQTWNGDPVAISNGEIIHSDSNEIDISIKTNGADIIARYTSDSGSFNNSKEVGSVYSGDILANNTDSSFNFAIIKDDKFLNPSVFVGSSIIGNHEILSPLSQEYINSLGDGWGYPFKEYHRVTQHFGQELTEFGVHKGTDFGWVGSNKNAPVYCIKSGTVISATNSSSCKSDKLNGCNLHVLTDNNVLVKYYHLAEPVSWLKGDRINIGDFVGIMGETGLAHGVHLHLELSDYENPNNKIDYCKLNGVDCDNPKIAY